MNGVWVDQSDCNNIVEKTGINHEQLNCIIVITRDLINALARVEITKEHIKEKYSGKISDKKLESLLNCVMIHKEHWYSSLLFTNTQETFFMTNNIFRQNKMILKYMGDLLDLLKNQSEDGRNFK